MIRLLSSANDYNDFIRRIPDALWVLRREAEKLMEGKVNVYDLLVSKRLSKHPREYAHDVFQAVAAKQLMLAGFDVYLGQTVQYLIVDAGNRNPNNRVRAAQLLGSRPRFDVQKYLEMLLEAGETLYGVFGYEFDRIRSEVLYGERQLILN